jgi:predicted nuclease with TOPRIM domain
VSLTPTQIPTYMTDQRFVEAFAQQVNDILLEDNMNLQNEIDRLKKSNYEFEQKLYELHIKNCKLDEEKEKLKKILKKSGTNNDNNTSKSYACQPKLMYF